MRDSMTSAEIEKTKILNQRKEVISVLQWTLTFLTMGPIFLCTAIYLLFTKFWFLSVSYFLYFLIDRHTPEKGGRKFAYIRDLPVWRHMAEYFPMRLVKTVDLNPDDNYILGYHPHGVLASGAFINFCTEGTKFSEVFPGITSHLSILKGHFRFPIYRDYVMSGGAIAVTKRSLEYVCSGIKGRGNLVCLIVGGAPEALDAHPGKYRVHISNHHGFVKVALRTGARLVPCISFNETRQYQQVPNAPGSIVRYIQDSLTKVLGISPPLFFANWVLPYRVPITTVVGAPIEFEQIRDPTTDDIYRLREKYIEALRILFDTHKATYDPDGENLEVV